MLKNHYAPLCGALTLSLLLTSTAYAKSEDINLSPVVVTASDDKGSKTVPSNAQAETIIKRTPGGVAVVNSEEYDDQYALNFEDTLELVPGVYAQKRFGEEVRLSIRGSGLSRGFHMRGLTLMHDGIPFNRADGSADFQEADPLAFQRLEIFKGANALQYGGTTLGGAINMVSKTERSHSEDQIRLEAGSFDTYRANVQSGRAFGDSDIFLSLTGTTSQGFREHDDQQNIKFNGNFGTALSDNVETRFYLSSNIIDQDLPGSVSLRTALDDPKAANASAIGSDWQRDIRSLRLANKTTIDLNDHHQLDVGGFTNLKDLFHPITPFVGVIDQESIDYGLFAQASGSYDMKDYNNLYRIGITTHLGETDAKVYQNIGGSRGNLIADADQESRNIIVYGENNFYLHPQLALVTGAQLTWSDRKVTDFFNPSESDSETYRSFNPKLGIMYEPQDAVQFFANVSRSYEPPTFSELTQGGTVGFTPIDAQEAWTVEIGTRGEYDRVAWDISLYRAWLEDELLQFTTGPGIPAATFNAGDTIHQGLELGVAVKLGHSLFAEKDRLTWRNSYSFSDFYFDGDSQYGDNAIPGLPQHFYQTELRYDHNNGWHAAIDLELASSVDVDFANTLDAPGYGIVGFNGGYIVNEKVSLYVDARNLLDQNYISTFSTIVNTAGNTAVFYPGEGRSAFAGVKITF